VTALAPSTQTDADEALRGSHRDVVQVLVDNHRQFLAFLERRVESRAVAEDILQDAFVRGMERVGALRSEESALAWFYRLLRNAVIDHHRRRGASGRALEALAREMEGSAGPDAETAAEICRCIGRLAGTLKPEYAEALQKVEIGGASVRAWAAEAGITRNNAAVRLFRAREALRQRLAASCGTCATHGCLDCTCGQGAL